MGSDLPSSEGVQIGDSDFVKLGFSTWNSAVVPVVVMSHDEIFCIGTAFNISPEGVFITAGHVIDEALDIVGRTRGSFVAVLWLGSGVGEAAPDLVGGAIPVTFYQRDFRSDLSIMRAQLLKGGEPYLFPCLRISARMRKQGTPIAGLGYTKFEIASDVTTTDNYRQIVVKSNFYFSTGEVTQLYESGRDRNLPSACFETSARFDSGMSGGPVITQDGWVCGVVASGLAQSEDASHVSWASGTAHIFILELVEGNESERVYAMVERGLVVSDAYFHNLRVTNHGTRIGVSFPVEK